MIPLKVTTKNDAAKNERYGFDPHQPFLPLCGGGALRFQIGSLFSCGE
jgi:hypothetical protein